jgi:hypothetical protein
MGSYPTKGDGFLRVVTISSMPSFEGEVEPSPHVVRVCSLLKDLFKV